MKKIAVILFAIALPLFAMAQDVKVGFINTQEVLMLMPELAELEKEMADFNAQNTKYLQEMEAEIQAKMAKYETDKATMSESIRKVAEEELSGLYQRLQTAQQTLYQEGQTKQQELIAPLQAKLKSAIENVSKKNGVTFTYDVAAGAILYHSSKSFDITPLVKKELGIL